MIAMHSTRTLAFGAVLVAAVAACGSGAAGNATDSAKPSTTAAGTPSPTAGPQTPDPGHQVIVVEALTDENGNNVFRPAKIEAHRGDVIRFTLKSGVHNVHFLPDSNP